MKLGKGKARMAEDEGDKEPKASKKKQPLRVEGQLAARPDNLESLGSCLKC